MSFCQGMVEGTTGGHGPCLLLDMLPDGCSLASKSTDANASHVSQFFDVHSAYVICRATLLVEYGALTR